MKVSSSSSLGPLAPGCTHRKCLRPQRCFWLAFYFGTLLLIYKNSKETSVNQQSDGQCPRGSCTHQEGGRDRAMGRRLGRRAPMRQGCDHAAGEEAELGLRLPAAGEMSKALREAALPCLPLGISQSMCWASSHSHAPASAQQHGNSVFFDSYYHPKAPPSRLPRGLKMQYRESCSLTPGRADHGAAHPEPVYSPSHAQDSGHRPPPNRRLCE